MTLTDPATGVGVWIRYTMLAPLPASGQPATAALWFLAMDPRPGAEPTTGRKMTFPVTELHAQAAPFELRDRFGEADRRRDGRRVRGRRLGSALETGPAMPTSTYIRS